MNFRIVIFCLYFFGIHTGFGLSFGGGAPFPYVLCGIASILVLPYILSQLRQFQFKNNWPMFTYLVLATLVTLIAAQPEYYMRSLRGILQLYYSVTCGTCLYFLILTIPRHKMSSTCLIILLIMAIASVLEFIGPLRGISNAITQSLSPNWDYSADARDISLQGAVRSKIFSPEPSMAALSFFWVSMLFLWSWRPNFRQSLLWGIAAAIILWTVRSPTLIAANACAFVTIYVLQLISRGQKVLSTRNITLLLILTSVSIAFFIAAYSIFANRFESILSGEGSFSMRITGALQFAWEYVMEHPFFGTGVVGDLDMIGDKIASFYDSIGMGGAIGTSQNTYDATITANKGISNNLALHFIYFGGLGGIIAAALLMRASLLSNRWCWAVLVLQAFAFCMASGGYNSAPIWCIGFSLVAAARLKEASLKNLAKRKVWPKATSNKFRNIPVVSGHSSFTKHEG